MPTLHDRAQIRATPDEVWPYVADPDLIPFWNAKLLAVDHRSRGLVVTGDRFTATYGMDGRRTPERRQRRSQVTVLEADAPAVIVYEHRIDDPKRHAVVTESYRLTAESDGTRIEQTVDLAHALPWWIQPIFWLISRFGRSVGRTTMETLAHVVEADLAKRSP